MDTDDLYSGANLDSQLDHYSEATYPADHTTLHAAHNEQMDTTGDTSQEEEEEDQEEEDDQDDVGILTRAWMNERNAPEILAYEGAALENSLELVDYQRQKMASAPAFVANILKMDVDRVRFLVRSYLRARLAKIERHARHYVQETRYRERMSQAELEYARGFVELDVGHVRRSFLDQLPPHLRGLDEVGGEGLDMVTKPDLDTAVFCRVCRTVGEFHEDPIVMKRNNIFITRYGIIRDLLEDGKVELI
ncbi:GINS complex subunit [Coemansia erecta]|uniref:DNA replication complex GINS protein SLD5 n=1 Tax=Coemansia erecta TaxID=147472 RepID=A0A9W7Y366_9FUNG|nr:GINS complex subunit [Coemansia erecta]